MNPTVIASQYGEDVNAQLRAQLPDATVIAVAQGVPVDIPAEATVLLARPFLRPGSLERPERPAGWPHRLQWVHLSSSGIDAYPEWFFEAPSVTTARGSASVAVAEFALAAIFAGAKRFPDVWIDNPEQWRPSTLRLVGGSVLGIVGFGAIGSELATRALALGLEVIALNRSGAPFEVAGVQRAESLEALFAQADHVVLAAPATADTHHLVNRELLALAKPGLHLINIARGSLIDERALIEALDAGRLGLATLDVSQVEPAPADHPFYSHPRIRLSPHISPSTPELWSNVLNQFTDKLQRFSQGEPLAQPVDIARGY